MDRVGQHSMFCAIFLDEALQVRDSKPVALRSSGIHSHAQVIPADNEVPLKGLSPAVLRSRVCVV